MTDWHFDIQPWCDRVEAAADRLFTGSDWQLRIRAITGALRGDVQRLVERGADGTPTLVIIGSLGEGKSWLARCFLDSHPDNAALLGELRSGQNHEDRTQSVTWFGPAAPPGLNGTASSPTATNAGLSKTNERFWLVLRPLKIGQKFCNIAVRLGRLVFNGKLHFWH